MKRTESAALILEKTDQHLLGLFVSVGSNFRKSLFSNFREKYAVVKRNVGSKDRQLVERV